MPDNDRDKNRRPGNRDKDRDGKRKGKDDGKKSKQEKKEQKYENFAINYGWALSFLEEYPELHDIFKEAVDKTWSAARFRAEVMESKWYKTHSDVARKTLYLMQTDPQTYEQRLHTQRRQIADLAGSLGLDPNNNQLSKWAHKAMLLGWDETKLRNVMAKTVRIMGKNSVGGELATSMEALNQKAYLNGVRIGKPRMQKWLREITRGNATVEEYNEYIKKMAINRFPNLAQEINAGLDVMDIADPYRQTMAELLELNPNQVDLNGKLMRRALSQRIPDNKDKGKAPQHRMMDMTDFEDRVRQDPRWMRTDNAKETLMDMGSGLLDMFGFTSGGGE